MPTVKRKLRPTLEQLLAKKFNTTKAPPKPLEITKSAWEGTPKENKSRHKDGSCWLRLKRSDGSESWQPVFWRR